MGYKHLDLWFSMGKFRSADTVVTEKYLHDLGIEPADPDKARLEEVSVSKLLSTVNVYTKDRNSAQYITELLFIVGDGDLLEAILTGGHDPVDMLIYEQGINDPYEIADHLRALATLDHIKRATSDRISEYLKYTFFGWLVGDTAQFIIKE